MTDESQRIGEVALIFLSVRDQINLFHWQTDSYAMHKASDKLVENLTEKMDRFIEIYQGTRGVRLKMPPKNFITYNNENSKSIIQLLNKFKSWLISDLPKFLKAWDTDLANLRDEILGTVNKTLYLFTLK